MPSPFGDDIFLHLYPIVLYISSADVPDLKTYILSHSGVFTSDNLISFLSLLTLLIEEINSPNLSLS